MPAGSRKLSLSKMNMMGMEARMMQKVMRNKQIDSLESLIDRPGTMGLSSLPARCPWT